MSKTESISVSMCPGCGAHLEDTWTGDDCGKCGFQYIHEKEAGKTVVRPRVDRGPSLGAGLVAVTLAWSAGGLVMPLSVVHPETGFGFAIEFGATSSPLVAMGLLCVSILVVTFSSVNRSPVTADSNGGESA